MAQLALVEPKGLELLESNAADPVVIVHRDAWRANGYAAGDRAIPEETPVALVYDAGTYAVMMSTPQDLEDFAVGFSLTEGVVQSVDDIDSINIVQGDDGIELRMWLARPNSERLLRRRRRLSGPTGCGLCGIESLAEAVRAARSVADGSHFAPSDIMRAVAAMPPMQNLNTQTRAVHAAAFWHRERGIVALREDVGRHNALDKLAGALARDRVTGNTGMVILTSRISAEMVQKTAAIGSAVMVSVSAPTALAVRMADAAGITLIAIARADGFEIFTGAHRISGAARDRA
jgi:FdhD protein